MSAKQTAAAQPDGSAIANAVEAAEPPDPAVLLRVEIQRFAKLDKAVYLVERKAVAKRFGVPVDELDKLVEQARPVSAPEPSESLAPPAPEPWPEPVQAGAVLDDLRDFVRRFVIVDDHALIAITLWVAFTYCFEIAETSPRLAILSPAKRCGKTRLLELLEMLCPRVVSASNLSISAIFRVIDQEHPTLLIDEADTLGAARNDELRGLLNSGHTCTTAYVIRSVPVGDKAWQPKRFSTWAPVALAAIGKLPDTWSDRSIKISMRRKLARDKVERLTRRAIVARSEAAALQRKLARFAADNLEALATAEPEMPALANDRACDNFEHLIAIAELAGPGWAARARAMAVALTMAGDDGDDSLSIRLLADIRTVLESHTAERIGSTQLCDALTKLETSPWAGFNRGRPLTPAKLARMLRPFEVYAKDIGGQNGYEKSNFVEAFSRYIPIPPDQSSEVPKHIGGVGESALSAARGAESPAVKENLTPRMALRTSELLNGGMGAQPDISAPVQAAPDWDSDGEAEAIDSIDEFLEFSDDSKEEADEL